MANGQNLLRLTENDMKHRCHEEREVTDWVYPQIKGRRSPG